MKHLLDVNLLLAAIWSNHSKHAEAFAANHSMKLATLDTGITHAAVVAVHQKP